MASTAIDAPISDHHIHAEALPVVDLRLLSQSELHALSLNSASSTVDLRRCDDVVVPTIDRSVFNESAGSRKQTYSRLRLAPRKPQTVPSSSSSSSNTIPRPIHPRSHLVNGVESEDNRKIVSLLKELLSGEGCKYGNENESDELVPVRVEYGDSVPKSSNVVLQQVAVDVMVDGGGAVKKRRGRKPRSDEMALVVYENPSISNEDKDREIMNENGVLVDISALANFEDPFGPELKRNTEGMTTDEELLGFITGLAGQWGSRRKRRKTVEASGFGDALPKGWKLLLSIKKKDGLAWLNCRRYISPSGREFVSCKEISSYLLSLFGPQDASVVGHTDDSNHLPYEMSSGNDMQQVAAFTPNEKKKVDDITFLTPTAIASLSADCKNQVALLREGQVQVKGSLTCHKCATPFEEEDDLLHHLLTAHIKSGKRRRLGTSVSDGVIIKDGVFECQFCHKIFHEKHRYNGHVGNHVKNYVKNLEVSSGVMTMPMNIEPVSVGGFLHRVDEIKTPISSPVDAVAEPSNSIVEECPSSGSCHNKLPISSIVETHTKENNQERLPDDIQNGKRKRKKKTVDRESSDYAGKKHKIDNKQPKVDVSAGVAVAQLNSSLGVETSLSMNENQNIHEKFDTSNLTKFTNAKVELEQNSDSSLLAFSGNVKTSLAEDNMNGVSSTLMKAPKQDLGSERTSVISNVNEILFGTENISDSLIYNTTEERKIVNPEQIVNDGPSIALGNTGQNKNAASGFKQQESSEVFSFDSSLAEPKRDVTNIITVAESNIESGSERGAPPPFDGLSSGINIDINTARTSTLDQPNFDMVERELSASPYDEQSSGFNINMNVHTSTLDEPNFDTVERGLSAAPYDGQSSGFNINMNSVHTSTLDEPDFEIDERGLSNPPYGGQSPGFNINMNSVRNSTLDEPDYEIIDSSGIKELTFDFGNNDARPDQNAETSFDQERSSESQFPLMSSNQQTSHIIDNRMGISAGRMDNFCMGKVGNIVSPSTVEELDLSVDKDLWKNELIMSLGGNQRGLDVDVMPSFDQKKVSRDCSFNLPRNEQRFIFENNFVEARHNSIENLNKGNISETHLLNQSRKKQKNETRGKKVLSSPREKLKSNEIRNSWSSELIMGLGNSQAGQDVDINRNFAGHSIDFDRNNHPYGVQNNVTGICNNQVQMHTQENAFRSNLFSPFSNDQLFGVDNNSKRFHPDTVWEGQRLGNSQSSRTSDHMMGYNSSLLRPVENVMNDATWRTNTQNVLPTGLADSSLPMAHSSNCFAPFDFISHKGDNEYLSTSEKFDNISGFEGMQSNSYEQMEYNFFTPQTNAPAGDSSLWLGKEAMMTKTVNRNQFIVMCMWCGNEFPLEGFNSGTQTGSMGYICPTCKAKISGQLNVL